MIFKLELNHDVVSLLYVTLTKEINCKSIDHNVFLTFVIVLDIVSVTKQDLRFFTNLRFNYASFAAKIT